MNKFASAARWTCILTLAILGGGCKSLSHNTPAQRALYEGIELYNKGDYDAAIKQFGSADAIRTGDKATQVTALKYSAFSYCLTGRQPLCRQQFEKALKLDPGFDLTPGEKGHPLWSPVFDRVKREK